MKLSFYLSVLFFGIVPLVYCQVDSTAEGSADSSKYVHFFNHDDPILDLDRQEEAPKEFKKKKPKRRLFYGYKTKKGFTKKGAGKRMQIEVFFYLKNWEEPSKYVHDIYWYDPVRLKIVKSTKYDPATSKLLHGPYKRTINNKVVERGVYYLGTKHSRWETWKSPKTHKFLKDTLQQEIEYQDLKSKVRWSKGWHKTEELFYYDSEKTLLKEVIPYDERGVKNGKYYQFFKDAKIKEIGFYAEDEKIGKWVEYHNGKRKHFRKQVMIYPNWLKGEDFEPYVEKEYDINGHLTYDREEAEKTRIAEEKRIAEEAERERRLKSAQEALKKFENSQKEVENSSEVKE